MNYITSEISNLLTSYEWKPQAELLKSLYKKNIIDCTALVGDVEYKFKNNGVYREDTDSVLFETWYQFTRNMLFSDDTTLDKIVVQLDTTVHPTFTFEPQLYKEYNGSQMRDRLHSECRTHENVVVNCNGERKTAIKFIFKFGNVYLIDNKYFVTDDNKLLLNWEEAIKCTIELNTIPTAKNSLVSTIKNFLSK